jgi:hypothetical protein
MGAACRNGVMAPSQSQNQLVVAILLLELIVCGVCARWHMAYPLSLRYVGEVMAKRGVLVVLLEAHRDIATAPRPSSAPSTCAACALRGPTTQLQLRWSRAFAPHTSLCRWVVLRFP